MQNMCPFRLILYQLCLKRQEENPISHSKLFFIILHRKPGQYFRTGRKLRFVLNNFISFRHLHKEGRKK